MQITYVTTSCSSCHTPLYMDQSKLEAPLWTCPACKAEHQGSGRNTAAEYQASLRRTALPQTPRQAAFG